MPSPPPGRPAARCEEELRVVAASERDRAAAGEALANELATCKKALGECRRALGSSEDERLTAKDELAAAKRSLARLEELKEGLRMDLEATHSEAQQVAS